MSIFAKYLSPHLRKPSTGFWGYFARIILAQNARVVQETFLKLEAQGSDNVLEVGFGYGSGLSYALENTLRAGTGKLFGVDYSVTVCDAVKKMLLEDIESEKLKILNADVASIPISDNEIDKVFHVNCFYFWPDTPAALTELKRVMKPGALMVTGLNIERVAMAKKKGLSQSWQCQPEEYLDAIKNAGFSDVSKESVYLESLKANLLFMLARKPLSSNCDVELSSPDSKIAGNSES